MRRLLTLTLFAGCGGLLLGSPGCSGPGPNGGASEGERDAARRVARGQAGDAADKGKEAVAGQPFRLPDDEGGALLGRVLPPAVRRGPLANPTRRVGRTSAPREFSAPAVPLPGTELPPPRLPATGRGGPLRPHLVTEERLGETLLDPVVPQRPSFFAGARTRVDSVDAHLPPPLPPLATPVPDRASLDDATAGASTVAALAAPLPDRGGPAPYQRLTVPEPYEHRRPLTLTPPAEGTAPANGSPQLPRP